MRTPRRRQLLTTAMIDKPTEQAGPEPAIAATRLARRPKPTPGRQGSGWIPPAAAAAAAAVDPAPAPDAAPTPVEAPTAKSLARNPSKAAPAKAKPAAGPLSLEDTIAAATALVVLRGPFTIVHVETTGPAPLQGEITSIHALQVDKHRPIAEYNTRALPLRALAAGMEADEGREAGRPAAKKTHGVPLQEAIAGLCGFLGDHRQFVFVHGAAATQAVLGQAARQYGMLIENPVGDLVDLARLAWPDRPDYSLAGLANDLLPASRPVRSGADATKTILALLESTSKALTDKGGRVSGSIVHWGTSPDTFRLKPSPW
jgi:hypothetical protein